MSKTDDKEAPHSYATVSKEKFLELALQNYCSIALVPSIISGKIESVKDSKDFTQCIVSATFSQRDIERKELRKFKKCYISKLDKCSGQWHQTNIPVLSDKHNQIIESCSPDSKMNCVIRKVHEKTEEIFYLEIWSENGLEKNFNLTAFKKHGDVYCDATFSSLEWSDDCRNILFIAESKQEDEHSVFSKDHCSANKRELNIKNEKKFIYEENWGEQKTTINHPTIVIFNMATIGMEIINEVPDYIAPGQCIWGPNNSIIFVGWWRIPYQLGLVYCENRRSAIFEINLEGCHKKCIQVSNGGCAVHSPRISPDKSKVIYLERDAGGPHRGCERLMVYSFETRSQPHLLYDIVDCVSEHKIGLFCYSLPQKCWLSNGKFVVMQTKFRTNQILVLVDVSTGTLTKITNEDGSWNILDTHEDLLLASFATPNLPPSLRLGRLNEKNGVSWSHFAQEPKMYATLVAGINWEKVVISVDSNRDEEVIECLLVTPEIQHFGAKHPIIIWPHGGPHTVMSADFLLYQAAFASLGFALLLVNYRGSLGFGEMPLRGLLGKIGVQDVGDVKKATDYILDSGRFDGDNVFIFGGSHGGFLSAHLIGQYPGSYKGCVLRNPVINLAAMVEVTDIPDWCYTEAGLEFSYDTIPTAESYAKMLECSPIFHVDKVRTPVLILVGGSDVRVPPSQGRSYYRALKSKKRSVEMMWYQEDCHPLNRVESEANAFVKVATWLFTLLH